MAGNIPPLVSSTPPPLNAFDDDEEEEEDEFGLYTTAEDSEYNDCISFKEKDEDKQHVQSRGEQDNASQDSATDSGLCPDSEGMSPIPHSDEEKVLKQNSCDKLCQNVNGQPHACVSELSGSQNTALVYQETVPCPNLLNGHAKEDHCGQESDDDFGNFEFAPSHKLQTTVKESCGDGIKRCLSPTSQYVEKEHLADSSSNHSHSEQYSTKTDVSDKAFSGVCELDSNENGLLVMGPDNIHAIKNNCKYEEYKELAVENLEIDIASSNDSSSFNSVDSSLEPKVAIPSQSLQIEQHDIESIDKKAIETHEDCFDYAMDHQRSEKENQIEDKNSDNDDDDDDDFNDFADFKGEIPDSDDLSRSVNGDQLNKHSKMLPVVEQTKLGESSFSLPTFHQEESDEEFSNFADFSSADCAFVSAQSSDSLENTSHIPLTLDSSDLRTESEFQDWVSVFPCGDEDTPLVATALLRQDDVVWSRLFPLESSPALSYQWNESLANRRLLTSLNIDSRNILLTPWSISAVPRFAANLSCGPLEPTKASEPLQPQPATSSPSPAAAVAATQESVPDAHFDWVGSGLTNPLDCPKTVLNLPKILSAEAENILNSLPDISFMRKTYIDFPIGDA